jgi:hypothetical protein
MPSACPYCDWSDHAYRLPAHLLTRHLEHIHPGQAPNNHCLTGYVEHGDESVEFSVCLTCKKGTVADTTEGHGLRWMSLHSKKESCRSAHTTAYAAFKAKWSAAKAAVVPPAEDPTPPPPVSTVTTLWEECKTNKKMTEAVVELEERVIDASEKYDDDPCFRPEEGFKQAIYDAIYYKGKDDVAKQKMDELVIKHDKEIRDLRGVIREQADSMRCLETMVKDHRYEITHLRAENDQMRSELEAVQDDNNAVRKENAEIRVEVGNIKDEMAKLREQMAAMQKEFDAYKAAHPL